MVNKIFFVNMSFGVLYIIFANLVPLLIDLKTVVAWSKLTIKCKGNYCHTKETDNRNTELIYSALGNHCRQYREEK